MNKKQRQERDEKEAETIKKVFASLTVKQMQTIVYLLKGMDDGCNFAMSRFKDSDKCGEATGKGFDCYSCSSRELLKQLGIKTTY